MIVVIEVIVGAIMVALYKEETSDENRVNGLAIESLIGTSVLLTLMSTWVVYMYKNRPKIINTEDKFQQHTLNESKITDFYGDLESNHSSFDGNISTHSNS